MAIKKPTTKSVVLNGMCEIMFDRYLGNNSVSSAEDKLYLNKDRQVCLPALNIMSFLSAVNTESATKLVYDSRKYRSICSALLSSISITPTPLIPFLRDGKPIQFGAFDEDEVDPDSGIRVVSHVARLAKGIPNPKERPILGTPWSLEFNLSVFPNEELSEEMIKQIFTEGGIRLGLGTYRKAFGKFEFSWS